MASTLRRIRENSTKIVVGAAVVTAICFTSWSYMWEGEFLSKWSAVATILSVIGAPVLYFIKMNEKEKELEMVARDERQRTSSSICGEIGDALEIIKNDKYRCFVVYGSKKVFFVNRFLNHDVYDGLAASAKISFLRPNLQQYTQHVFQRIRLHNHYLHHIIELQDTQSADLERHYKLLEEYEAYLQKEIPRLAHELKKSSLN